MGFAFANGTVQRQPLDSIVVPRDESAYLKVWKISKISQKWFLPHRKSPVWTKRIIILSHSPCFWGFHVEFLRKSYAWRIQYLGSRWFQSVWPPTIDGNDPIWQAILLMEEILHHLDCNTNYKTLVVYWDKRPTSTGELTRISGCHRVGFFPHQRSMRIRSKCLKLGVH